LSSEGFIQNLRNMRVIVVHPRDMDGEDLVRQLKRIGCKAEFAWPPTAVLPPSDAVFFLIGDPPDISWISSDIDAALVAILDSESPTLLKALLDSNAHSVLVRPLRAAGVLSSLVLALSLRAYELRLIGKASKIEETLKARREIEKATRIIMALRNMSEADAYQFIRKQATAKRVAVSVIANSIIGAQEILDGLDLQKTAG